MILEIIFDVVGAIIVFTNTKELIDYHSKDDELKLVILIFPGLFFWILGLIFLCLINKVKANNILMSNEQGEGKWK